MTDYMWDDFNTYVTKLESMIMKIHRNENIDSKQYFTKTEYSECNNLVFELVFESTDDSEMSKKLQDKFGMFIESNVLLSSISILPISLAKITNIFLY